MSAKKTDANKTMQAARKAAILPGYISTLQDSTSKERYLEKLKLIGGNDPYEIQLSSWLDDVDLWPSTTYIHVGMYLAFSPSPYTGEDLLNYKSLDCYRRFVAGWVREVLVFVASADKRVMTAKVNHSQKLREKPLTPWVICEASGKVISCHCNCMAGLGESCSHVASLLWAIEAGVQLRDSLTVTQKKAYWVLPNSKKDVPYAPVEQIKFQGKFRARSTWKAAHHLPSVVEQSSSTTHSSSTPSISPDITSLPSSSSLTPPHHNVSATLSQSDHFSTGLASLPSPKQPAKTINPPTDAEIQKLYSSLAKCKSKPAILSLTRDYSSSYIPLSLSPDLPSPLSALYNSKYLSSHYIELLSLAEDLEISITEGQCLAVEKSTKTQFQSRIWYNMRAGRITASRLRAVCTADEAMPPLSLIMSICYPDVARFNSHATEWGCKHEDEARQRYSLQLNSTHDGLTITKSGLFINHASPFLGASPDALVDCLCCGSGICEIKCPYCHRDDTIEKSVADKSFCLEAVTEGKAYQLKRSHMYYYQVQLQLYCSNRRYCDFVVWTSEDIFVERIFPNTEFITGCISKAESFFKRAILPELLGKFFSRAPKDAVQTGEADVSTTEPVYCYCQQPESGQMVACDNTTCPYQWFHFACLKLSAPPRRKIWYCPDCRKK